MSPNIHGGGRGGRLGADDISAVLNVYPASDTPTTPQLPGTDLPPLSSLLGDSLLIQLTTSVLSTDWFSAEVRISQGRFTEDIAVANAADYSASGYTLPLVPEHPHDLAGDLGRDLG